jgi:hypothetical protein
MKKMKKNFSMMAFVSLFTVVALCSCSKDDNGDDNGGSVIANNTLTVAVEDGNDYNDEIVEVRAFSYFDDERYEIASGSYINGGFTLKLPATIADKYLESFGSFPEGLKVSNPNVKGTNYVEIYAYNESGRKIGEFYCENTSGWEGVLMWVNENSSITGTFTNKYNEVYTINMHLKKGWNMLYERSDDSGGESTTQAPSGMKWSFYHD